MTKIRGNKKVERTQTLMSRADEGASTTYVPVPKLIIIEKTLRNPEQVITARTKRICLPIVDTK